MIARQSICGAMRQLPLVEDEEKTKGHPPGQGVALLAESIKNDLV